MKTKICPKCKLEKELKQFDSDKFFPDGRSACCSNCINEYQIIYQQNLLAEKRIKRNKYCSDRRKNDINFKIRCNLSSRTWSAVKEVGKADLTLNLLGCTIAELKKYLELKFKSGMKWNNYGKWHIDHIKPCAKFDLSDPAEQQKCFHYTNLQPLWATENLKKSHKYQNLH